MTEMYMTSVVLPLAAREKIKAKGMTIQGVITRGLELMDREVTLNELLLEKEHEIKELRRKIERIITLMEVKKE